MVSTTQVNRTGADAKATVTNMKLRKGLYKSNMWQHNELPLVFAVWSDNAAVNSLSNLCSPIIILNGVQQWIKIDKVRQCNLVGVPVPLREYSEIFHMIDKGNSAKAKYDKGENRYIYDWIGINWIELNWIELNYYTISSSHFYILCFFYFVV